MSPTSRSSCEQSICLEGDTPETLASRVQAAEREIYPRAIQLFSQGRLLIEGRRVRILESGRQD